MALLDREREVINSTVGWNGWTYMDTFYSLNAIYFARSAENFEDFSFCSWKSNEIPKGFSETIRGNSFGLFRKAYFDQYNKHILISDNWLSWLIGFIEGDGAILEHKGRSRLVITQKDSKVLLEIQKVLGFGKVKHFSSNNNTSKYSRYIVEDNHSVYLFFMLLNGNLVIQHRLNQLVKWQVALNSAIKFNTPEIIHTLYKPTLNDAWISGFTDAEGCFTVNIDYNKKYVTCRYILDQNNGFDLLTYISFLFNHGNVSLRSGTNSVYRLVVNMNNPKRINFKDLLNYFNKYPLKTSKSMNFAIWQEIIEKIQIKSYKTEGGLKEIEILKNLMGKFIIENNPTGCSKYS